MKIGQKLILGAAGLTLVPLAITAVLLWQGATQVACNARGHAHKGEAHDYNMFRIIEVS